jgi:hypothetical protein
MPGILFSFGEKITEVTAGLREALPYITHLAQQGTILDRAANEARLLGGVSEKTSELSANEIIRRVRLEGFEVRRQAALKVIKQVKSQVQTRSYIAGLRPSQRPLMTRLPFASTKQTAKYNYHITVVGTDANTGDATTQNIIVASDRLISKREAETQAILAVIGDEKYQMVDIRGAETQNITLRND